MRNLFLGITAVALTLTFAACHRPSSGEQELQALGHGNYDVPFWTAQSKRNTPLWHRAIEYCNRPPQNLLRSCKQFESMVALQQATKGMGSEKLTPTSPNALDFGGGSKAGGGSK